MNPFILIALGFLGQFFILLFFVILHELAHCLVGVAFGLHLKRIQITPLGAIARLSGFEKLVSHKKYLVLLAGPLMSFLLFVIFYLMAFPLFWRPNLILVLFNLLPLYPLDGGRLLFTYLTKKQGLLYASQTFTKLNALFLFLLLLLSLIQVILFPFNISLLLLWLYLHKIKARFEIEKTLTFYHLILKNYKSKKILPLKPLYVHPDTPLLTLLSRFHPECLYVISLTYDDTPITLYEDTLTQLAQTHGLHRPLFHILPFMD